MAVRSWDRESRIRAERQRAWGQPFTDFDHLRFWFAEDGDPNHAVMPEGSEHWFVLYEVDGDVVVADPANGAAYWVGGEWTGEPLVKVSDDWRPVASFIFWSLLEARWVRPTDLQMLAAARQLR